MRKSIWQTAGIITLLIISGCGGGKPGAAKMDKVKEIKPIPVMVEKIELSDLAEYISFTAKLEGITDIYLLSESSGKVIEINKHLGDWVKKGEAIGKLENDSYLNQQAQAEASLLAMEASLELAEMQFKTSQKLYENANISQSEYISAQSNFKKAQSGYESALAARKLAELAVKNAQFCAPVSGYISDLKLEVGSYIGIGQQVCRLVDHSRLKIKTGLGENDISGIKKGQAALISYNDSGKILKGKISGIGIAPVNGSVNYPVEIELENPERLLLPGMVVSGRILRNTYENALHTSINNLIQLYDEYIVYVINSQQRAEQRKVETGRQIEREVIIKSGIEPGDLLVIEGANSLSDNALVEIKN